MQPPPLPFPSRVFFAWACFFKVLFDGAFAGRVFAVRDAMPKLLSEGDRHSSSPPTKPPSSIDPPALDPPSREARSTKTKKLVEARPSRDEVDQQKLREDGALSLLGIFQREGRLVDFLKQDVASFADDEIGAAVRVVHAGCQRALDDHLTIEAVRSEEEGSKITLEQGFDKSAHKLTGDVRGSAPFRGVLRHKGWRAKSFKLPTPTEGHDASLLCPAEVEL